MNAKWLSSLGILSLLACLLATPLSAVEPDEILSDPTQEARARALSANLRCMVCQNQSIDDSSAPLARDLRILVRERILAGDSDEEVMDFVVDRYGEFVLLTPVVERHTYVLWIAPLVVLLLGAVMVFRLFRQQKSEQLTESSPALTTQEREALNALLNEEVSDPPSQKT